MRWNNSNGPISRAYRRTRRGPRDGSESWCAPRRISTTSSQAWKVRVCAAVHARAQAARGASSIRTSEYGRLAWPVDGNILYDFGRAVNPTNNTVTRWNGIGIAAASGTPVRAVASGEVRVAESLSGYGRTVIVEHGGGDYSVYGSLGQRQRRRWTTHHQRASHRHGGHLRPRHASTSPLRNPPRRSGDRSKNLVT